MIFFKKMGVNLLILFLLVFASCGSPTDSSSDSTDSDSTDSDSGTVEMDIQIESSVSDISSIIYQENEYEGFGNSTKLSIDTDPDGDYIYFVLDVGSDEYNFRTSSMFIPVEGGNFISGSNYFELDSSTNVVCTDTSQSGTLSFFDDAGVISFKNQTGFTTITSAYLGSTTLVESDLTDGEEIILFCDPATDEEVTLTIRNTSDGLTNGTTEDTYSVVGDSLTSIYMLTSTAVTSGSYTGTLYGLYLGL